MKIYEGLLSLLVGIIVLSAHVSSICQHYNATCPEDAPCCNDGWCSNDPSFCNTGCDPENSFSTNSCYPKPQCINYYEDFKSPKISSAANFSGNPYDADWTSDFKPDYSGTDGNNLILNMKLNTETKNAQGNYQGFGTTISSTRWMLYGTVSARIQTGCSSLGVVSSFVVSNNTGDTLGDEIDYEWVGLNRNEVQSNYYWNGTLDYTKGMHHSLGFDASQSFHIYTIDWQPEYLSWSVDGVVKRTLNKSSTLSDGIYKYPSVPSRIAFSIWDGGMGPPGTAAWAGTPTNWNDPNQVYTMMVDWVNITCANPGDPKAPWPPAGYGPKLAANSTVNGTTSYTTLGANPGSKNGSNDPNGTNSPDIVGNPSAPDYSRSQLRNLAVPIGVVLGLVLGSVALFAIWKCAFRPRSEVVAPQSKW